MLADWAARCVGLWLSFQQSSSERHVGVECSRTANTALHEELATGVARLQVHVEVKLVHDDEQLAEPKA